MVGRHIEGPSGPFFGADGQGLLIHTPPPCGECRWWAKRRCSGPTTVESQLRNQGKRLSCFDTEKTAGLLDNLDRRRLPALPSFPILQGLPTGIPMLCEGMPEVSLDPRVLYGVSLDDLLRMDGSILYSTGRDLRAAFQLPPEGRLCLVASVRDDRLEEFWHRMDTDLIWRQIRRLGFEFATGLSCTVFEQHSRNGQLFNQERNLLSCDLLARAGVPVVPIFCDIFEEDLDFAVQWLAKRPALRVVAGMAQSWRTNAEFARFLARMRYLKSQISGPLHFVIIGCSSVPRIPELFGELENVTVTTANFVLKAISGESWDPRALEFVPVPQEIPRGPIIYANVEGLLSLCELSARHPKKAA
jgi:hypothetical protein